MPLKEPVHSGVIGPTENGKRGHGKQNFTLKYHIGVNIR
jgi:hypothetical protein